LIARLGPSRPLDHLAKSTYIAPMERGRVLSIIREHTDELRAAGVLRLSLFGSVARDEATEESDVDVVVRLEDSIMKSGFGYFGAMEGVRLKLQEIIGRPVDVVSEPINKERLAREIERDRAVAF
jgi:uncharacterized protein